MVGSVLKQIDFRLEDILWKHAALDGYTTSDAIAEIKELFDYVDTKTIQQRQREFKDTLRPFLEEYGEPMIVKFFDYWTEHSAKGRKMRFEKQKVFDVKLRLKTWSANQKKFSIAGLIANRK